MNDVKTLSFELSIHFRPYVAFIQCIFQKAFSLCQSSKFGECESGSLLFALCLKWNLTAHFYINWSAELMKQQKPTIQINQSEECKQISNQLNESKQISELLLSVYNQLMRESKQDFLKIAKNSPMHGLLTSIRATMALEDLEMTFYQELIQALELSVQFMLEVLSGGKSHIRNASFAGNQGGH